MKSVILSFLFIFTGCYTVLERGSYSNPAKFTPGTEAYWQERIRRVQIGMTGEQVALILPPHPNSATEQSGPADSTLYCYWVDRDWKVCMLIKKRSVRDVSTVPNVTSYTEYTTVIGLPTLSREPIREAHWVY